MTRPAPAALAAVVVLGLALVLGGCDSIFPQSSPSTAVPGPNAVRQLMLEQLRDKYGEDFECVDLDYRLGGQTWPLKPIDYTMSARRAGDPDPWATITAKWDPHRDDPMTDNYLEVKMAHLFTAAVQDSIDAAFPLNIAQIHIYGTKAFYGITEPYDLPPGISEADYRVWAAENAGLGMDVLIPVEPGVTKDDIAALLPGAIASPYELGLSWGRIRINAYSPTRYYDLAIPNAENKYVFTDDYMLHEEFMVDYIWNPQ
ncbi:MAG: hypothetical protein LBK54_03730 [Propionibacteriaceae bacterium]|jgi:hypothetical protein|nr:hypothetical protein [Propionibacteriaceae bacterium]